MEVVQVVAGVCRMDEMADGWLPAGDVQRPVLYEVLGSVSEVV